MASTKLITVWITWVGGKHVEHFMSENNDLAEQEEYNDSYLNDLLTYQKNERNVTQLNDKHDLKDRIIEKDA